MLRQNWAFRRYRLRIIGDCVLVVALAPLGARKGRGIRERIRDWPDGVREVLDGLAVIALCGVENQGRHTPRVGWVQSNRLRVITDGVVVFALPRVRNASRMIGSRVSGIKHDRLSERGNRQIEFTFGKEALPFSNGSFTMSRASAIGDQRGAARVPRPPAIPTRRMYRARPVVNHRGPVRQFSISALGTANLSLWGLAAAVPRPSRSGQTQGDGDD